MIDAVFQVTLLEDTSMHVRLMYQDDATKCVLLSMNVRFDTNYSLLRIYHYLNCKS